MLIGKQKLSLCIKIIIIFAIICLCFLPACVGWNCTDGSGILDYYGEYTISRTSLPFKTQRAYSGGNLGFKTELSMEQMTEKFDNIHNITAEIFNNKKQKFIFIAVKKEHSSYYFVVTNIQGKENQYELINCAEGVTVDEQDKIWLAPIYALEWVSSNVWNINLSFDQLVEFYQNTGKEDFIIDYDKQSIQFYCRKRENSAYVEGYIYIHYFQNENQNQLYITH